MGTLLAAQAGMTGIYKQLADPAPQTGGISHRVHAALGVEEAETRLSEVVSALSYVLDITEGQAPGHAVRTCVIGMRIAEVLRLSPSDRSALFYTLLLKDLGGSGIATRLSRMFAADDFVLKRAHRLIDWTSGHDLLHYAFTHSRVGEGLVARAWNTMLIGLSEKDNWRELSATRSARGAELASMLGLGEETADGIRALDEHWDGAGLPEGRHGNQIPLLARIAGLAQSVESFASAFGVDAAYEMVRQRRRTWFDPALVNALHSFERDHPFWTKSFAADRLAQVSLLEPPDHVLPADETRLDSVAEVFARVIDGKSAYTVRHSENVAAIAVAIAGELGASSEELVTLRRAGLLHDIGKVGISNLILDKPGDLTDAEIAEMRKHTGYTLQILGSVRRFAPFAALAAAHHERLDGSGYHQGLTADALPLAARILAVADVAEALSAHRPYRNAMSRDEQLIIMRKQVGTSLDPTVFEVFEGMGG
jgi:putative nucleotidyltransferase with HDIG domain